MADHLEIIQRLYSILANISKNCIYSTKNHHSINAAFNKRIGWYRLNFSGLYPPDRRKGC